MPREIRTARSRAGERMQLHSARDAVVASTSVAEHFGDHPRSRRAPNDHDELFCRVSHVFQKYRKREKARASRCEPGQFVEEHDLPDPWRKFFQISAQGLEGFAAKSRGAAYRTPLLRERRSESSRAAAYGSPCGCQLAQSAARLRRSAAEIRSSDAGVAIDGNELRSPGVACMLEFHPFVRAGRRRRWRSLVL